MNVVTAYKETVKGGGELLAICCFCFNSFKMITLSLLVWFWLQMSFDLEPLVIVGRQWWEEAH